MVMDQAVLLAAEQVHELVLDKVLEWGQAVNEAESVKNDNEKAEPAAKHARKVGAELQALAMSLAKRFRPRR